MTTTLSQLGQIALSVGDLSRSLAFYRDVLGIPFLFEAPPSLAFFNCGGVRLMLSGEQGEARGAGSTLYFRVEDIEAAHADLTSRGLTFEDQPHLIAAMPDHELWMAFFRDPDGHLLGLMAEKPLTIKA